VLKKKFSKNEYIKKSSHLLTLHSYALLKMYCHISSLPISYRFHVMLLLVTVNFASNQVDLVSKPNCF